MGRVILSLALPAPYPAEAPRLDHAELALLIALRWWVAALRRDQAALPELRQRLGIVDAEAAAHSVDALMRVAARTARRPITIYCPCNPQLSVDELQLLHAASLTQDGQGDAAIRLLAATLLTSAGAEFALGPLEGLGNIFAAAGLNFSRRPAPPAFSPTLH